MTCFHKINLATIPGQYRLKRYYLNFLNTLSSKEVPFITLPECSLQHELSANSSLNPLWFQWIYNQLIPSIFIQLLPKCPPPSLFYLFPGFHHHFIHLHIKKKKKYTLRQYARNGRKKARKYFHTLTVRKGPKSDSENPALTPVRTGNLTVLTVRSYLLTPASGTVYAATSPRV